MVFDISSTNRFHKTRIFQFSYHFPCAQKAVSSEPQNGDGGQSKTKWPDTRINTESTVFPSRHVKKG
jgi:hypothetical protein